jgi:hypothetical protein
MGAVDWDDLNGALTTAALERGVIHWDTPPSGGGDFIYAYNALQATTGAAGKYCTLTGYAPTGSGPTVPDGGCSIRGCVQRIPSPGATGMSPFLYACAQGAGTPSVNDWAYLLGLSDSDPYTIALFKAPIAAGLVEGAAALQLRRSAAQYVIGDALWHHLRLDAVVQDNGDVLLQCLKNDLAAHPLGTTPQWLPIPGMDDFVDDKVQIATGTPPLWGGYLGWAFALAGALNRRGGFTALEALREP